MLFDLFRQRLPKAFFEGASDMHSHLLPGVDDGFPDGERALEGMDYLRKLGYAKVKLTPHFMRDNGNTRESIEAKYGAFLGQVGASLPVEVSLGGEYMLDDAFLDRFEEGFLTLDEGRTLVLCETSYMMVDPKAREMIYQMMLKGYQPVIAHPERYNYASLPMYKRWKERDYLLQLNLLSLGGAYGDLAKAKAHQMLKEGMYDFVGTDLHRVANVQRVIDAIRLSGKELDQLAVLLENNSRI